MVFVVIASFFVPFLVFTDEIGSKAQAAATENPLQPALTQAHQELAQLTVERDRYRTEYRRLLKQFNARSHPAPIPVADRPEPAGRIHLTITNLTEGPLWAPRTESVWSYSYSSESPRTR
jgi:hypothetical protein